MKLLPLVALVFLLTVTSSPAHDGDADRRANAGEACRLLQREVQDAVPVPGHGFRQRIRGIRNASRIVRQSLRSREIGRGCAVCVLRQVVRGTPASEQRPCGHHDVCVAGYRLRQGTDACVDRICERDRRCCRRWWGRRCVAQVEDVCARSCDACDHGECTVGVALNPDCSECTRQVCSTDPYCCDTAWDPRCTEEARTLCEGSCQVTSTTVVSTSTTLVTTTTVPICRSAEDCSDDDPCTIDSCNAERGCEFEPYSCEDANACTLDLCSGTGACINSRIGCSDGDACTVDDCDPSIGCVYEPVDCTDADDCTADTCDPVLGCVSEIDPGACRIGVRYGEY